MSYFKPFALIRYYLIFQNFCVFFWFSRSYSGCRLYFSKNNIKCQNEERVPSVRKTFFSEYYVEHFGEILKFGFNFFIFDKTISLLKRYNVFSRKKKLPCGRVLISSLWNFHFRFRQPWENHSAFRWPYRVGIWRRTSLWISRSYIIVGLPRLDQQNGVRVEKTNEKQLKIMSNIDRLVVEGAASKNNF